MGNNCFTEPAWPIVLIHAAYVIVQAGLPIFIALHMKADAQTGRELAVPGENLSRQAGQFDLRLPPMTLKGSSSRTFKSTLAHRSASAAREIKGLIGDSLQRVEHGSTLATRAGTAMRHVVGNVGDVARLIENISASSDAQSHDVDRFSQGMGKMDAMLERDVQHVKGVASASASLREKARTLREAMSIFLVEPAAK
ncbi:methyl-accepting chemotaxis protein [Paraburkholderia caffeinilytica]|uniref:methyl-accepting chemotaxis protein n=1 Tax=Paraburkholderia caffeinilytica TaxID=1761016 RepID=UPI003DA1B4C5